MDQFSPNFRLPNGHRIINRELWKIAEKWENEANEGKAADEPRWRFDCNFKLDFDGKIGDVKVESRFYPPAYNDGDFWEGRIRVSRPTGVEDCPVFTVEAKVKADDLAVLRQKVEIDSDYKFRDVASLIGERLQVRAPTEIHLSKQENGEDAPERWRVFVVRPVVQMVYLAEER